MFTRVPVPEKCEGSVSYSDGSDDGVGVDDGGDGDGGGDDGYNTILKFSGVISSHLENFIPLLELALLFCLLTSVFMFH